MKYTALNALKLISLVILLSIAANAQTPETRPDNPKYDAELGKKTGADELGMRAFVLVILKSSTTPVPKGKVRDEMFKGHMANMDRLAKEGKLAFAGPLDGVDGWRGLFILSVPEIDEAKKLVATDPVIAKGEMVAEYHKLYGSAALMLVNEFHQKVGKKSF